jgi:NAD(P)-dependent dehydrogenase (short-subunit alcohol dehydrogenase family)
MSLKGKTVLIVGGAAGIGLATAQLCANHEAKVIIADLNESAGTAAAKAINATFFQVNVSDEPSVKAMFERVEQQVGRLDVLLHTAGILKGAYVPLEDFSLDVWRSVIDINLTGSFLCSKYAAPLIKKAGRGVIVLVSSIAATAGSSSYAYGSSKGGVTSLGITLARKLADDNIRVNVVCPGNIDTAMKRSVIAAEAEQKGAPAKFEQMVADSNLGTPEGVAKVLAWLASDDAEYVQGAIFTR